LAALGEDPSQLITLIVIYDDRAQPTVIRDPGGGTHAYAEHVFEMLEEYERAQRGTP
jgi:hypothetical protein